MTGATLVNQGQTTDGSAFAENGPLLHPTDRLLGKTLYLTSNLTRNLIGVSLSASRRPWT